MRPSIAIITPNTLAAIGLSDIIHRMMPGADVCLFAHHAEMVAQGEADEFFHYFISANELLTCATYFLRRQHKTIVLVHGEEAMHLPQGFHTLNVFQSEQDLISDIITLAHRSHSAHGAEPEVVKQASHPQSDSEATEAAHPHLTPREREVLKGIVEGLINKEIAARMGAVSYTHLTLPTILLV